MPTVVSFRLRNEALALLDKQGSILDVARELSQLMRQSGIPGVIIEGIAVVLHGHVRTTRDIDVFVAQSLQPFAELLVANGFAVEAENKEFVRDGVPIHLVTITLAPKKLIRTRRASEGSASEPSLARRVSMCKDAKLSCRG